MEPKFDINELRECLNSLSHETISKELSRELEGRGLIVYQQIIDTRNWTPELIAQFLFPVFIWENPHNSTQSMRLYRIKEVMEVEKLPEFKKQAIQGMKKLEADRKAAYMKRINRPERMHPVERRHAQRIKLPADWESSLESIFGK